MSAASPRSSVSNATLFGVVLVMFLGLQACSKKPPPAPEVKPSVSVYEVALRPVGTYREFVGRTEARKTVALRARIEGELKQRGFAEGAAVLQGQLLFAIEDSPYIAAVQGAQAELDRARSEVDRTTKELARGEQLAPEGYLSQQDLDKLDAAASQARSTLKAAEAKLESASINLGYTRITAPFDGVIGKTRYNVGTIVGPSSEPLAELSASDPVYVNFQLEESAYITYLQQRQREGKLNQSPPVDISMRLPNNDIYPESGSLNFADTQVEPTMGTVSLRAEFPNPDGVVVPGMYVTLLVEGREKDNLPVVPQAAVQAMQGGYSVLLVSGDNTVEQVIVRMGRRLGPMWVVKEGLQVGDRVIIDGLQKVRSGIEVEPVVHQVDFVTGAIRPHNQ